MATSSPEDKYRLHLQGPFSSQEEKDTFLSRFEAAKQLLAPGCKRKLRNATIDRYLYQRVECFAGPCIDPTREYPGLK